jgi:ligand-binding SRPBCC domain-containing protein
MNKAYRFEQSQFIPRAREEVFTFIAEASNLERITPAFLHFRILTPRPISMEPGTLIDYQLRLYGVPFRWRTRIESFEPASSFTDLQLSGPYRRWHHRHEFVEVSGGTEMKDIVDYELPLGHLGVTAQWLFVRSALDRIFEYRRAAITEIFGQDEGNEGEGKDKPRRGYEQTGSHNRPRRYRVRRC